MNLEHSKEHHAFREQVERFAHDRVRPRAAEIDASDAYPISLVWEASSLGLLGITVPREHGGLGLDQVSCALAVEAVARASATMAVVMVVANALVNETVRRVGTAAQQERWLRLLATGEELGVFALSEENAGTDAANQETTATLEGDGWRLNGRKVWVANLEAARVGVVFAATTPGARGRGITAFLLPLDREGVRKEAGPDSLGVRGLGCMDLVLDNVRVDPADVLGEVNGGFAVARHALDAGRVGIAAQSLGVGGAALDEAIAHAKTRQTFGRPIAQYQAVQWFLADSATELEAARMLTMKAAAAADAGASFGPVAAMAKLAASEAAHRAADRAMQILASAGYSRGSTVERLFRDIRASEIYQGTSEVQRMIIAGAVVAGEI